MVKNQNIKKRTLAQYEAIILDRIVDAMLDAKADLEQASVDQWADVLVQSCRKQRFGDRPEEGSLATAC